MKEVSVKKIRFSNTENDLIVFKFLNKCGKLQSAFVKSLVFEFIKDYVADKDIPYHELRRLVNDKIEQVRQEESKKIPRDIPLADIAARLERIEQILTSEYKSEDRRKDAMPSCTETEEPMLQIKPVSEEKAQDDKEGVRKLLSSFASAKSKKD